MRKVLPCLALAEAGAEAGAPAYRTEEEWRTLEHDAVQSVSTASDLVPALGQAEEKAILARITSDVAARLAGEADEKVRQVQPQAAEALQALVKRVQEWQGSGSGTSTQALHGLALSRLTAWCAQHLEAESYQEVDSQDIGIGGLEGPANLVAEIAAVELRGKRYALLSIAIGEEAGKGQLAGTSLHWGCSESEGTGWRAPPAGWHTDPNVSHPKGAAWETPFAHYAPLKDGQPDVAGGAYVVALQLPLVQVLDGGGIEFILKRDRQPEWISNAQRRNFFVSLAKAADHFKSTTDAKIDKQDIVLPEERPEWVPLDSSEDQTAAAKTSSHSSMRQQLNSMAQLLESPPPSLPGNGKVTELTSFVQEVSNLVSIAEAAAQEARTVQEVASGAARDVQQAEQELREAQHKANAAILTARQNTALLKGKSAEVSLEDLQTISQERLSTWSATNKASRAEGTEPMQFAASMDGLQGHVAGHALLADDDAGRPCAVVTLAAGESFPDGLLQDAKVHWGTCLHEESGWERPPQGWLASPSGSQEAGGVATETPLERTELPSGGSNQHAAGYAATLQLPLDSGLVGALSFVVHAPGGRWVACHRNNAREDFFFSLSPLVKAMRKQQSEKVAKKAGSDTESTKMKSDSSKPEAARPDAAPEASQDASASAESLSQQGGLGSAK